MYRGGLYTLGILSAVVIAIVLFTATREVRNSIIIETALETATHAADHTPVSPDGPVSNWAYSDVYTVEEDTMVTNISVRMRGASIDSLHHLRVLKMGQPSAICGATTHKEAKEIYTASRNTVREDGVFTAPYGIPLTKGDKLFVEFMEHTLAMPHGPGDTPDAPVLVVELTTATDRTAPLEFILLRLDDTPCSEPAKHQAFTVPVGPDVFVRKSSEHEEGSWYVIPQKGVILERGVNTWPAKGGGDIRVYRNGTLVDTFSPSHGEKDWQFVLPIHHEPIAVEKGDRVTIEADYKNPFDQEIVDASGMFGFYFAPEYPR